MDLRLRNIGFISVILVIGIATPVAFGQTQIKFKSDSSYDCAQTFDIRGLVTNPTNITSVVVRLINSAGELIGIKEITISTDGSFSTVIFAGEQFLHESGNYSVMVQYGRYVNATTTLSCINSTGKTNTNPLSDTNHQVTPLSTPIIPSLKDTARSWSVGQLQDSDFIKILVQNGIIKLPVTGGSHVIPSWVKNNARWLASDQIYESDFIKGIEYLVQARVISMNSSR